jgi:hypothetical protein
MASGWKYEERSLNGGAGGEAFRIVFNGSGMHPATILAREAIQNSVDAAATAGGEVGVDFILREVSGKERRAFEKAAGLNDIACRAAELDLPAGHAFEDRKRPMRLLYVNDRETTGLSGDPTDGASKLRKLLMEIGGSQKSSEGAHSGGSYGFGKAVYAGSSRISTIFIYSRTTDQGGEPLSVLMGCAYHPGHEFDHQATTGRGFFGSVVSVSGKGERYDPFVGSTADELAASLGMARAPEERGTSILIVDTQIEIADICSGVEEFWWPRLKSGLLDVELKDQHGVISVPKPRSRNDLAPFHSAFDVCTGVSPVIRGKNDKKEFNRLKGLKIGSLGLHVMMEGEASVDEFGDVDGKADSVALIRSTLMVVEYYKRRSIGVPPIAGVFIADDEIDAILRRSEPPAHDCWDRDASRLDMAAGEGEVVRTVLERVWSNLKTFQKNARPVEAPRSKRLSAIERALAGWFGSSAKRLVPPGTLDPAPVSVQPAMRVVAEGGKLCLKGTLTLSLKQTEPADSVRVRISLACNVKEEDSVSSKDPVQLSVDHCARVEAAEGCWTATLTKDAPIVLGISSLPYDPMWTVVFVPEVTPISEGADS